jgi:hypothetical protein
MQEREEMPEDTLSGSMDFIALVFTVPWLIAVLTVVVLVCIT